MSASKWKPYPEYRDSHIDWIGKIPKHWQVLRSKYVFSEKDERSISGKEELLGLSKSKGIVRKKEMEQRSSVSNTYVGYKKCVKGDIVMNKLQAWNGVLDVSNYNGIVSPDYTVFEISEEVDKYYGTFLLKSPLFVAQLGRNSKGIGSGFMRLYTDYFGDIEFLLPPTEVQMSISKFIQKIHIIVTSIQQQLEEKLELLEERRSALIRQAVTKGLNPDTPMKDSGIDWIGEIPEHWEMIPAKWMLSIRSGEAIEGVVNDISETNHVPVIGGNGVMGYSSKLNVNKSCIAVGRVGALCGNVHLVDYEAWITDNSLIIDQISDFDLKYFSAFLRSLDLNKLANKNAQPLITGTMVKDQRICKPPIEEQVLIFNYIEKINKLSHKTSSRLIKNIETLVQYRTALVSAAVTGKIDVQSL